MVELIKQRGSHDCGIAAAAMAFGCTYEEALADLRDPSIEQVEFEGQKHVGIVPEEFSWMAFKRGIPVCVVTINEIQPKDHWAYVWRDVFRRVTIEDLGTMLWNADDTIGILGVNSLNSPGDAHWIVVEAGKIYDPSTRKCYEDGMQIPIQVAILVRRPKLYLVREHVQVGDELILTGCTNLKQARAIARHHRKRTGTVNFDVVECIPGEMREDLSRAE